ncbi:MAG: hypothetical protein DRN96_07875 [Thermoproteota archaeon]|nr:MAG: hypothetical protein DRN96_07875 [Candidatus Korarchaeota archaeon]
MVYRLIKVRELVVRYKLSDEPAVKGVNAVFDGRCIILGPNGSGKTTLFKVICGLINITSGEVWIDEAKVDEIYSQPGVLAANFPEVYGLVDASVHEVLELYSDLTGGSLSEAVGIAEELGLTRELMKRRRLRELSAGQLKSVCAALALASGAKHVLLDEPFEQLDPAKKGRLIRRLSSYPGVVLLNTHETWLLKSLEDWTAYFMCEGRLYGPASVRDLLRSSVTPSDEPSAIMRIEAGGKVVSIVREEKGTPLTSIESLDRIYDMIGGG